jgi:hypothetical protein
MGGFKTNVHQYFPNRFEGHGTLLNTQLQTLPEVSMVAIVFVKRTALMSVSTNVREPWNFRTKRF